MVALVVVVALGAAAFQVDPRVVTELSASTTGIWLPAPTSGDVVRVDAASGRVTARVEAAEAGSILEVDEHANGVVVVDRTDGRVVLVDPALNEVVREVATDAVADGPVDIGPTAIAVASPDRLTVVDTEVGAATTAELVAPVESVATLDAGAVGAGAAGRVEVDATGAVVESEGSSGHLVRVGDEVVSVTGSRVEDLAGNERGCLSRPLEEIDHAVGSDDRWVVAVSGDTVHVSDLDDGACSAVRLDITTESLGRPVVADGRVFVPEPGSGDVHIVEPFLGVSRRHPVLSPGRLRVRARGEVVAAYDETKSVAALLDRDGVVSFVDTSEDERGIQAALGGQGSAIVAADDTSDNSALDGGDGVRARGAPSIDTSVVSLTIGEAPATEEDPVDDGSLRANFNFSADTVVVDESVRLIDSSTGNPESWVWDFGDGSGAEGPEVEASWSEPGSYDVTLRVARGGETDEVSQAISVVSADTALPPAADFDFSTTVVGVGDPVVFEDRSRGDIDRWRWDFDDGTSASTPDATKSWKKAGLYAVTLTVANEQGPDVASIGVLVVDDLRPPVASIEVDDTDVDLGEAVRFRASTAGNPAAYAWDFGDGRTSVGREVVHVFLKEGTYTVRLTAANNAGSSQDEVEIRVAAPTLAPEAVIATLPTLIEVDETVAMTSLSTNAPDREEWTFGDGATAAGGSVSHAWSAPGTYSVSLRATNAAGSDTETTTVNVVEELPAPVAVISDFDPSPFVGENTVFLDGSVNATSWQWDFGDGGTSNARNPLHAFSTPGTKTVTLTVTNRNGFDQTSVQVEPRLKPIAGFAVSSTAVRAGERVAFTDTSVNAVSWSWSFGDGATASGPNPTHTYAAAGSYGVTLTVQNSSGDRDTFGPVNIAVDPAPPLLGEIRLGPANTGTVTTRSTVTFEALPAAASGPIVQHEINYGDGSPVATAVGASFSHAYDSAGPYVAQMRALGPLGDWSPWISRAITVVDPPPPAIAIAASVPSSAVVGPVALAGTQLAASGPISRWRWEIVQGAAVLAQYTGQNASHNFADPGAYTIRLIADGPVTSTTVTKAITILVPPPPVITSLVAAPSPATVGQVVTFTPSVTGSVASWEWDYGAGFVPGARVGAFTFTTAGPKQVRLRVRGPGVHGGEAIATVSVTVRPRPAPTVPVASPSSPVVAGTTVTLSSSDANGLADLTWNWTISNGTSTVAYTGPTIQHTFGVAGTWTVTVRATDPRGVSAQASTTMVVTAPLTAGFASAATGVALQVQFTDTSTPRPISTWSWNFGGAISSGAANVANPLVTYAAAGTYPVTLTVTAGGQSDPVTINVTVS